MTEKPALHVPVNQVRFVTAASLLTATTRRSTSCVAAPAVSEGAEVIHLGHDRSPSPRS
jgi:methylmalonyl-CoA mutase